MIGRNNSDANDSVSIDLSPMIDCIFILLIFFIVTTVFVDEVGTEVNKPDISSANASTLDSNSVIIQITANDRVMHEGAVIGVGGVMPLIKPKLDVDPDTSVSGDHLWEWMLGANWYFNGHRNKISTDLAYLDFDDPLASARSAWRFRLQWDVSF